MDGLSTQVLDPRTTEFLSRQQRLLIGGGWTDAADGAVFETVDPSNAAPLATVAQAGVEDVDRAVRAARSALESPGWRDLKARERAALMFRLADLMATHLDELAELESLDSGKPLANARRTDVPQAIDHIRYFAGWVTKIHGDTIPSSVGNYLIYTRREPVGVCALIIPWNYPLLMASWKLGPALACGNTMILKPAEQTPLSAIRLGELALEAGFPPGVVNILQGVGELTGAALVRHPGVDKIAFTGSTEVGRSIVTASAGNLARVSLELGGKSPNIVFADADIEQASESAAWGIFYNMGEDCSAGSRLFVQEEVFDEVIERVSKVAEGIRVGPGLEPSSQLGPLITSEQRARVEEYLAIGCAEGARVITGGRRPEDSELQSGFYLLPTILTQVPNSARVAQEEIFGPVVTAIPFRDEQEAIRLANDTRYGLAAGLWTNDVRRAHRVSAALKAGTVWVNEYGPADAAAPFGGFKESGHGREHGATALDLYTETKTVWMNLD